MTTLQIFLGVIGALLLGAMSPGPSFVLVSRIAVVNARPSGIAAALGMGAGGATFALLALCGLTAILQQVDWLYLTLKIGGGLYLTYLGINILLHANVPLQLDMPSKNTTLMSVSRPKYTLDLKSLRLGLTTQLANPKTAIVYASIFAALLPSEPPRVLLFALPFAVFIVEAGWYTLVALVFSSPAPKHVYLRSKRWLDWISGSVLGLLGAKLIVDELR